MQNKIVIECDAVLFAVMDGFQVYFPALCFCSPLSQKIDECKQNAKIAVNNLLTNNLQKYGQLKNPNISFVTRDIENYSIEKFQLHIEISIDCKFES